jgi:hypothetical protein
MKQLVPILLTLAWWGATSREAESAPSTTIWTRAQSPYVISNSYVVPAGVVLIIEAGCDVWFQGVNITVYGKILANGTPESPIRFGSPSRPSPAGSITLQSSDGPSEFRHAHFVAMGLIQVVAETPYSSHLFDHCLFRQAGDPQVLVTQNNPVRVLNCVFQRTDGGKALQMRIHGDLTDETASQIWFNAFSGGSVEIISYVVGVDVSKLSFRFNKVVKGRIMLSAAYGGYNLNNVRISDCDLLGSSPSIVAPGVNALTVTNCDLYDISGSQPSSLSLAGNWWGTNNVAAIHPRVFGGALPSAEPLLPLAPSSRFPQADVDGSDGGNSTTQADADLVKRYLVGLASLTPDQRTTADVDRSGTVDVRDALMIESFVNGLIWKLPDR